MTTVNKKKEQEERERFFSHFPSDIGQRVKDYVRDVIFLRSRYIFTTREKGLQYGYCTHCKKKVRVVGLKQNEKTNCRCCNSLCIVKKSGISRKYLRDRAHIVFYEKSLIDPTAMIARSMWVQRDYSGDYETVESTFCPSAMYLFKMGESMMYEPYWGQLEWRKSSSTKSEYSFSYIGGYKSDCPKEWIEEAAAGTPFQYSTWQDYHESDSVKLFDLYSRYPCIEYLTKFQMKYFVSAKLNNYKTYGAINWNGKTLDKVIKLDKQRAKEFISSVGKINNALTLRLYQINIKEKSGYLLHELEQLAEEFDDCWSLFQKLMKYSNLRRTVNYVAKQVKVEKKAKRAYHSQAILTIWRDYIADCVRLGLDLEDDAILFPSNLHDAHQLTIQQIQYKESEELNRLIRTRLKTRSKYAYEQGSLMIRAAADSKELVEEGRLLRHCVGSYAERYANGKCDILVIRNIAEPDKPYYTMEIIDGKIIQCRGKSNCSMTEDVQAFVDQFENIKLKAKKKNRVSGNRAARQEAAV